MAPRSAAAPSPIFPFARFTMRILPSSMTRRVSTEIAARPASADSFLAALDAAVGKANVNDNAEAK